MIDHTTHWQTRDGRVIAYADMTTEHLQNVIKLLDRNAGANWLQVMETGEQAMGGLQGEMAQDAAFYELTGILRNGPEAFRHKSFPFVAAELRRRRDAAQGKRDNDE